MSPRKQIVSVRLNQDEILQARAYIDSLGPNKEQTLSDLLRTALNAYMRKKMANTDHWLGF